MENTDFTVALGTVISLAGLWVLWAFLYRDYCVDSFRQRMFALRDSLFDFAANEDTDLDFSDSAYGQLRSTLNGFIRFGHRVSLIQFVAIILATEAPAAASQSYERRWKLALKSKDAMTQEHLRAIRRESHIFVLRHIVLSSPLLMITIVPAIFVLSWATKAASLLSRPLDRIDSAALAAGSA
jgi:hypothetical protein